MRLAPVGRLADDRELIPLDDRGQREPTHAPGAPGLAHDEEGVIRRRANATMVLEHEIEDRLGRVLTGREHPASGDLELRRQGVDGIAWLDLGDRDDIVVLEDERVAGQAAGVCVDPLDR